MLADVKVAEGSPASKEQHHSHQGLQWPGSRGCSGEGICLYLFSFSSMRTRHLALSGVHKAGTSLY